MHTDMESFEKFMKDELVKYIHQELLKGHSPIAIKETLLKGGHHHDMVEEVLNILKETNYNIEEALQKGAHGRILKQDMFYDILNAVIRYIELMLEQGHDIHEIEHMLYKFGHTKELIDRAIDAVLFGKKEEAPKEVRDYVALAEKFILPLMLAIYIVFSLMISSMANVGVDRVMLGFVGLLLTIVFGGVLSPRMTKKTRPGLLAIPVLLAVLLYFASTLPLFSSMDMTRLAVLNAIFGLIIIMVFIVTAIDKEDREEPHYKMNPKPLVGEEVQDEPGP